MYTLPLRSRTCGGLTLRSNNTSCLSTKRPVRASLPQTHTEKLRQTGTGLPSAPRGSPSQSRLCRLQGSGKAAFVPLRSIVPATLGPLPTKIVDRARGSVKAIGFSFFAEGSPMLSHISRSGETPASHAPLYSFLTPCHASCNINSTSVLRINSPQDLD